MIETLAPGKLFIAGEYAVVHPAQPAVLVAVDRFIRVRLVEGAVTSSQQSPHVSAAIAATEQLRVERGLERRPFTLHIESELENEHGTKYGLGSSAAVTVAVVQALTEFYGLGLDQAERFKLALLATITVSPKASGGDLAASTFGGWIRYVSPDREALAKYRDLHGVERALTCEAWNDCQILPLPEPNGLSLLVGWTGSPAATAALVDSVRDAADHRASAQLPHEQFLAESRACVDAITSSLESGDRSISAALRSARKLMQQLGEARGIDIETEKLRILCDIAESQGFAAKPSGAGGGDCGIVLITDNADAAPLVDAWQEHDISWLDLAVHHFSSNREERAHER